MLVERAGVRVAVRINRGTWIGHHAVAEIEAKHRSRARRDFDAATDIGRQHDLAAGQLARQDGWINRRARQRARRPLNPDESRPKLCDRPHTSERRADSDAKQTFDAPAAERRTTSCGELRRIDVHLRLCREKAGAGRTPDEQATETKIRAVKLAGCRPCELTSGGEARPD